MAPRLPEGMGEPWTDESVAEGKAEICHHLDVIGEQLADGEWLVDTYSLADVCYAPFVLVLERVDLGNEIAKRSVVSHWIDRLKHRESVIQTMMPANP